MLRAITLSAVLYASLLAGCAASCPVPPPPVPHVVDTGCDWVPALSASTNDTAETKRKIIAYEAARQEKCRQHHNARASTTGG
ncbi:hypothetical protein [Paraburkholderia sp.]|uniref:hypothetical protein n=1 Tax=Paraburkholderia sp. TaxID=1926495 RepID=UPI003D6E6800